jgi:hypothetical protein
LWKMWIVLCNNRKMIQRIRWFEGKEFEKINFIYWLGSFRLDDLNSKYRFMEMNLLQKKKRLRGKLPDIQICLGTKKFHFFIEFTYWNIDMIEQLRKYKEKDTNMDTNFLLAHNLYGKATIPPTNTVRLKYPLIRITSLS